MKDEIILLQLCATNIDVYIIYIYIGYLYYARLFLIDALKSLHSLVSHILFLRK